jgi:hypothetical protein
MVVLGAALMAAGPAFSQGGTSTSAGDQQYVDPLTGTTTSSHTSPPASPPPAASAASGSSSSHQASPTTTSSSASTASSAGPAGRTLPFTGMNIEVLAAVGAGLLGAGLLLRRAVRRSE